MFFHNISRQLLIDRGIGTVAVGTSDTQCGDIIDTLGYETIIFGVAFGAIVNTAVTTIKVQYGNNSNGSDMADISGATVSVADTGDNLVWLSNEVYRPTKRYVRLTVTRSVANSTINGGFVLMARGDFLPPVIGANAGNTQPTVIVSP